MYLNGLKNSTCEDSTGYIELAEFTILENNNIQRPKNTLIGIDHCNLGGERRPGYIPNNPIYFKITHTLNDSSYLVLPDTSNIGGSNTFNNTHFLL